MNTEKQCGQCHQYTEKFGRKYRGKRYCMDCYLYFFIKRTCSHCGKLKRIHRDEKNPLCYQCYSAVTPCARCHRIGRPVGRIDSFGLLCNSCANVVGQPYRSCSICKKLALLSIDKKNGTSKPVCASCRHKLYPKCPQCGKRGALHQTTDGKQLCYRCANGIQYYCSSCGNKTYRADKSLCQQCQATRRNDKRTAFNAELLSDKDVKAMFLGFVEWLTENVGPAKAAIVQNKTFDFFTALESAPINWQSDIFFLASLDGGYFRKSSLIKRYLNNRGIPINTDSLRQAMDLRTVHKNINAIYQLCPGDYKPTCNQFFSKRLQDFKKGRIKPKTLRLESSSIKRLYEQYVQFGDFKTAIFKLAGATPGLKFSLTGYLKFAKQQIEELWPPEKVVIEYRLAYLAQKLKDNNCSKAELFDFAHCFIAHFYSTHATGKQLTLSRGKDGFIVHLDRNVFWLPFPNSTKLSLNEVSWKTSFHPEEP